MLEPSLMLVACVILVALVFDFVNGFHDAANSVATIVSTRVLSPRAAVLWAAFFNFVAAFAFGTAVAKMVATGVVHAHVVTIPVILAALIGAIAWDLITWWYGIPSSSSHALIGAFAGAGVAAAGWQAVKLSGFSKIGLAIILSPLLGLGCGWLLMKLVNRLMRDAIPSKVDHWFRRLQLVSAAIYSFSHGSNDAQKTMGIIMALLVAAGQLSADAPVPISVILGCHLAIALGTLCGGWRIVQTMGMRIVRLRPVDGFSAETGGGVVILLMSHLGIPVSTTHTITGAITGVGVCRRFSAVRWWVARRIVWAWVLTIPCSAAIAAGSYWVIQWMTK